MAALICAAPALAANEAAKSACQDARSSPDEKVLSCTRVIDDKEKSDGERFAAYVSRARAHFSKQDWDSSIADYDSAVRLVPDVAEIYDQRGAAYDRQGDRERAISNYSAAIRLNPSNPIAYSNRGLVHYKAGAYDRAIADFDEAIRLNPNYAAAYNGRGVAHSKSGDHRRAIADFTEAIRLNGFYANAYNNRGIAYANIGEFSQAIADIQAAVRLADNNANFYNELAWTYFRSGDTAVGLPYADQALHLNPSYANAYDTRGSIYEALGENAKAVADFKRALSLDSSLTSSTEALRRLAQSSPMFASFSDVIHLVQERGWQVDLGNICTELSLAKGAGGCAFKQLSVQEAEGRRDPRGFNVSALAQSAAPYVVVFHLNPLVGEFFVVSPEGHLISAFLRFKGTGYKHVPNEDVQAEFRKDIAYWTDNFARLKRGLEVQQPRQQ